MNTMKRLEDNNPYKLHNHKKIRVMEDINPNLVKVKKEYEEEEDNHQSLSIYKEIISHIENSSKYRGDELEYSLNQQKETIEDSYRFVKYLCSSDLSNLLDLSSIDNLEGHTEESNFRLNATRMRMMYSNQLANNRLGKEIYDNNDISTLYNHIAPLTEEEKKEYEEDDRKKFEIQFSRYHKKKKESRDKFIKHLLPINDINEQDIKREILTIRNEHNTSLFMKILIENYVYVTYVGNKNQPKKRYKFNLPDMASKSLEFGIQHSKNKFSKNDIRYPYGSHLAFESGVIVETGSTNPILAAKLLEHTLNIFRIRCGYYDIEVKERTCHNVVATGSTSGFGICLELFKDRYPYVTYDKRNFAGAIVKISDIDNYAAHHGITIIKNKTSSSSSFSNRTTNTMNSDFENYEDMSYKMIEDEYHRKFNIKKYNDGGGGGGGGGGGYNDDNIINDYNTNQIPSTQPTTQIEDDDIYDILHHTRMEKEQNMTALVFPKGQVILVGSQSRDDVIRAYTELFNILETCRDTEENILLEKRLIRKRRECYLKPNSVIINPYNITNNSLLQSDNNNNNTSSSSQTPTPVSQSIAITDNTKKNKKRKREKKDKHHKKEKKDKKNKKKNKHHKKKKEKKDHVNTK